MFNHSRKVLITAAVACVTFGGVVAGSVAALSPSEPDSPGVTVTNTTPVKDVPTPTAPTSSAVPDPALKGAFSAFGKANSTAATTAATTAAESGVTARDATPLVLQFGLAPDKAAAQKIDGRVVSAIPGANGACVGATKASGDQPIYACGTTSDALQGTVVSGQICVPGLDPATAILNGIAPDTAQAVVVTANGEQTKVAVTGNAWSYKGPIPDGVALQAADGSLKQIPSPLPPKAEIGTCGQAGG